MTLDVIALSFKTKHAQFIWKSDHGKKILVVAKLLRAHVDVSSKHSSTYHVYICVHGPLVNVLSNLENPITLHKL